MGDAHEGRIRGSLPTRRPTKEPDAACNWSTKTVNLETAMGTAEDAENAKDAEVRNLARITPRVIHG
ncbi:MAG: hypothetical protein QOE70_3229 [Chthoniobacter sp.]|jgi:hypothetical protein|nr:hypothetical protein [Chthoniobacter sp.]